MQMPIDWLLEGPPWAQYRTRLDLLDEGEDALPVQVARQAMLAHPLLQGLLAELADWPGGLLKSHKAASHPLHKLVFLADLGLRLSDPGVQAIVDRILAHQADEGPFQVLVNIHPRWGGTGQDQWAWMLCDAPLLLYALIKLGLSPTHERIERAVAHLVGLAASGPVWPCAVAPELGKFKGPGRRSDPCPYATLVMLRLLSALGEEGMSAPVREAAGAGARTLLELWAARARQRPFLFAMGSDFAKLKAPFIWYDLLHVADVLSRCSWLLPGPGAPVDARLGEMLAQVGAKADAEGRFTPESVWLPWKAWDFGQKKVPSPWLTLLAQRVLRRMDRAADMSRAVWNLGAGSRL